MKIKSLALILAVLFPVMCFSQEQQPSPQEIEKQIYEGIEKEISKLEDYLKLEDWQIFYIDSILTHDYFAMNDEFTALSKSGSTNSEAFSRISDKWAESMYQAFKKVLTPEQWAKYDKMGPGKAKIARDKREAKRKS